MDHDRYRRCTPPLKTPSKNLLPLLSAAVKHLDADCSHGEWFRIGAALHTATNGSEEGRALFDWWSSRGKKYPGSRRINYQWECYGRRPGLIGIGTLRHYLRQAGISWSELQAEVDNKFDGHSHD